MNYLTLDIASKTTGYALLTECKSLLLGTIETGHIKADTMGETIKLRAMAIKDQLPFMIGEKYIIGLELSNFNSATTSQLLGIYTGIYIAYLADEYNTIKVYTAGEWQKRVFNKKEITKEESIAKAITYEGLRENHIKQIQDNKGGDIADALHALYHIKELRDTLAVKTAKRNRMKRIQQINAHISRNLVRLQELQLKQNERENRGLKGLIAKDRERRQELKEQIEELKLEKRNIVNWTVKGGK